MGIVAKILAAPFRLANLPFRIMEKCVAKASGEDDIPKGDRILSVPLAIIADSIEEAVGGENK